jgi:hypothetical protein
MGSEADATADSVKDRVFDCRGNADESDLADALDPERVRRIWFT